MAKGLVPGAANASPAGRLAPPVGGKVWLLHGGGFGRVVAIGQGGLVCRVRLEGGTAALVDCPGCELLPLAGAPD